MSDQNVEMFIDEDVLAALHNEAETKFPGEDVGVVLNDPSCCGGIVHIDLMPITEIQRFTDLLLVFPSEYKDFGLPIYIDKGTMQEPIPRMRIVLSSVDPVKFSFENNDFWEKNTL